MNVSESGAETKRLQAEISRYILNDGRLKLSELDLDSMFYPAGLPYSGGHAWTCPELSAH